MLLENLDDLPNNGISMMVGDCVVGNDGSDGAFVVGAMNTGDSVTARTGDSVIAGDGGVTTGALVAGANDGDFVPTGGVGGCGCLALMGSEVGSAGVGFGVGTTVGCVE